MTQSMPPARRAFRRGSGGVGCAAQEAGQELEILVFVPGADLVHRGVHAGVDQVEAQDLRSAVARRYLRCPSMAST